MSFKEHPLAAMEFDNNLHSDSNDVRRKIWEWTWGNSDKLDELTCDLFTFARFPTQSFELVDELSKKYFDYWFQEIRPEWGRDRGYPESNLLALYFLSRDFIAPVKIAFIATVLDEFKGENSIHFLARDAFSEFAIAVNLMKSLPDMFPKPDVYNYIPISVRLMKKSSEPEFAQTLKHYFNQFLISKPGKHALVDIGFTGDIPNRLAQMYPTTDFQPRFLMLDADEQTVNDRPIMKNAVGFAFDRLHKGGYQLPESQVQHYLFKRAMEDTFGGITTTTTDILKQQVKGKTIFRTDAREYKPGYNKIKRLVAQRGMRDAVSIYIHALQNGWDKEDLINPDFHVGLISNLKHLFTFNDYIIGSESIFVPHEATNP